MSKPTLIFFGNKSTHEKPFSAGPQTFFQLNAKGIPAGVDNAFGGQL